RRTGSRRASPRRAARAVPASPRAARRARRTRRRSGHAPARRSAAGSSSPWPIIPVQKGTASRNAQSSRSDTEARRQARLRRRDLAGQVVGELLEQAVVQIELGLPGVLVDARDLFVLGAAEV